MLNPKSLNKKAPGRSEIPDGLPVWQNAGIENMSKTIKNKILFMTLKSSYAENASIKKGVHL
jgi:hypothetical protein